jgi:hypothetical protein
MFFGPAAGKRVFLELTLAALYVACCPACRPLT